MKALTLIQPWASLIADGRKTIETRSWAPPKRLIGQRIAIHAGIKVENELAAKWGYERLPVGAVIATAKLAGVRRVVDISAGGGMAVCVSAYEKSGPDLFGGSTRFLYEIDEYGDFGIGRVLWILDEVKRGIPMPAIGKLGLWYWDGDPVNALRRDIAPPITAVVGT